MIELHSPLSTSQTAAAWAAGNPVLRAGHLGYESDTGIVRVGDGVTAFLSLSAGVRTAKQTAQVTNSSNVTASDLTGLVLAVQAGHLYEFMAELTCQTDLATAGPVFSATVPALTHGRWNSFIQSGATGTSHFQSQSNTFGGAVGYSSGTFAVGAGADFTSRLQGKFKPSADGTVQLRMRSSTNGQVMTAKSEGYMKLVDCG